MDRYESMGGGGTDVPEETDFSSLVLESAEQDEANDNQALFAAIDRAKRDGKEDFDPDIFKKEYWKQGLMSPSSEEAMSEEVIESYIRQYYLNYPEAMTIKDFARKLEHHDSEIE